MPKYVEGVELTQEGMHAIFARMGHPEIKSGTIYNGVPTIDKEALDKQGFMPVLTGVGPKRDSGHWIMLIKGSGNQYHLFDPMGKISGEGYQDILTTQLPEGSTLSVIPNDPGLNMGLCGYWVASVGLKARSELNKDNPPNLETLGQITTDAMKDELTDNGYPKITGWLKAVADKFPEGDPQPDAKALRQTTEKDLHIELPSPVPPVKDTSPKEVPVKPTAPQQPSLPVWNGFSLFTDDTVRTAAKYAYDNYLGKPYTGTVEATPANIGGQMVYRQVHGLAHTIRTMAYAEIIVEEARKAKLRGETLGKFKDGRTIADVTPEELKKIMIAQAFFVTGRDDEESAKNYAKYHEQSRDAFLKYVKENEPTLIPDVFKDQEEVNFYARVIEDKNHDWDSTPAHVLINQGHMVDLVRVKQPPESFLQRYFSSMQRWIGTQATEAVFSIQRQFFHATYEAVTGFDSDNKEPHLVVSGLGRYVIGKNGQPIREAPKNGQKEGELKVFPQTYQLKENERFMRVDEFLKLPEIQSTFPGSGKHLEGGMPGMSYMAYWDRLNSRERARCENDVDFCLKQLEIALDKAKIDPLKEAFQPSKEKGSRQPNMDEIAAARIIQQIMANPDCIHDDHVLINGQKLEEKFFRDLLAKCDMAVVGSLLNDTDIKNIDTLMRHEKDTEFHSTDPKAVPVKIGDAWENRIRKKGGDVTQMKHDLIFLMQNDAWYFSRVNAIAQNRDKGSSFKEVLFTTLMTPLTNKSLMDTSHVPAPKKLYRGLNLPEEFKNKLINQANAMIANTTERLFTDHSSEAFKQIKLNDFSQMSGRTCASTTTNYELTKAWDSNVVFQMLDPDGLLNPKQVGSHMAGSEDEFSIYLPEDVALVPVKVTFDGKTTKGEDRCVFTLVAVKSPDFIPRHESGYAVEPFMKMQKEKVTQALDAIEKDKGSYNIDEQLKNLRTEMVRQAKLPLREGIFDRISHRLSLETSDNKISPERRDFLNQHVIPVLQECHIALRTNDMEMMQKALAKFPTDKQWSAFKSGEAVRAKAQMDVLKQQIEKRIMLQSQIIPALTECSEALDKQNVTEALQALNKLPAEKEIGKAKGIGQELRGRIVGIKQELAGNLEALQRATTTPIVQDAEKMRVRYEALVTDVTKRVTDFEKIKPANLESYNKTIADLNNMQQELNLLRNEKIRMHTDKDKAVDFSDIEALEKRLQDAQPKLYPTLVEEATKGIKDLAKIPESISFDDIKSITSKINGFLETLEFIRNERIKNHGESTDPLDMSDLDQLKNQLQSVSQILAQTLLDEAKNSLDKIKDPATLEKEAPNIKRCLDHFAELEKTLDSSEKATKQKEDFNTYKNSLTDKQEKAYPEMLQLQYKSEALITQLRNLCNIHHDNLAKTREVLQQELNKTGGILDGFFSRITTAISHAETKKEKELARFKTELNNDKSDINQLIRFLAKKNSSELEEGLGITKENAEQLHGLLKQLGAKATPIDKLQENARLIDEISTKMGSKPVSAELVSAKKAREYYQFLLYGTTQKVGDFEKVKPLNPDSYKKAMSDLNNIQEALKFLRSEKSRIHDDKEKAVEFSDIEALEKRVQNAQPKLLTALLEKTTRNISALVKIPRKLTFEDIKSMTTKLNSYLETLEFIHNDRIKNHGDSPEPLDMSDLDGLKRQLQTFNQNLTDAILRSTKDALTRINDRANFEEGGPYVKACLGLLTELEKTLDSSVKSMKQKEEISACRNSLLDKQEKAHSGMLDLQSKSKDLITQLRDICKIHHDNLAEARRAKLLSLDNQEGGLLGGLWSVTNKLGVTTDTVGIERMQIKMKEQTLRAFKTELTNDKLNTDQVIAFLANKKPSELEEGLGISKENTEELHGLLSKLTSKMTSKIEIEENTQLIDEISTKIGTEPVKLELTRTVDEDESDTYRRESGYI
ncbi:SidE phosphodiesterase domain-containing protein [Legionella pneumophila]|uniref:SidE phosphodiesterase domain-containing protein n=1 Tax=Legionella pneumophila TaxID=446 RepID=UPI00077BBC6E|nr:SidE phosphodiesterase domain-containing protein [Legionella pneumophila]AMP96019.1 septation initiation protein [Legionella pneumophila subsp. pascullei]HAT6917534.1 NAD-dependent ubiquitin ligase [Legionella pneumophila]